MRPVSAGRCRCPRSSRSTSIGSRVRVAVSENSSAEPIRNIATSTTAMSTTPVMIVGTEEGQRRRAQPVAHHEHPAPVEAIGEGAGVQAEQQPGQALQQPPAPPGTARGSGRRPGAVRPPAPGRRRALVIQDDASSQRKPRPSRGGATVPIAGAPGHEDESLTDGGSGGLRFPRARRVRRGFARSGASNLSAEVVRSLRGAARRRRDPCWRAAVAGVLVR